MSIEVAAVCDRFAVAVSDGLAWNPKTGRITSENSRKQIRLGPDIAVAALADITPAQLKAALVAKYKSL